MVLFMKAHSISIRNFQPLERAAIIIAVLSLAAFLFAAAACSDRLQRLQLTNPFVIAGMVSLAVLLVASLTAALSICLTKSKQITQHAIRHRFGYESSTSSSVLLAISIISLLLAAAFCGKIMGNDNPDLFFSKMQELSNPLVVAAIVAVSVFLLSFVMYAAKNIISPDKQTHVIILSNQQTIEEAKVDQGMNILSAVLPAAGIDITSIASCDILAVSSRGSSQHQ